MKKAAGVILLAMFIFPAMAQVSEVKVCGTENFNEEQRIIFEDIKANMGGGLRAPVLWVPVKFHIVGTDSGVGYYSMSEILRELCELNTNWEPADIQFYILGNINYIDESDYYDHNGQQGYSMMQQNNVSKAVNAYYVNDPNGACGYFSWQGNAVAIKKACAAIRSTTLTHELGHYMFLPHTFSGWEGGQPPPANDQEKVDGTNCTTAGDGFCDTPPDYESDRWSCPYTSLLLDPNGDTVVPDGTFYMSYSNDGCQTRFSNQQISAVRQGLQQYRPGLLGSAPSPVATIGQANLTKPVNQSNDQPADYVLLEWDPVPGATKYHVMVSRYPSFAVNQFEKWTTNPYIGVSNTLVEGQNYKWKVKAFHETNTCTEWSQTWNFTASEPTGLNDISSYENGDMFLLYPNPASSDGLVNLRLESNLSTEGLVEIYGLNGQVVYRDILQFHIGSNEAQLQLESKNAGMYLAKLSVDGKIMTFPFLIK